MKLEKANRSHLQRAALDLSSSDREEMERIEPGRNPVEVLAIAADDPTIHHISDHMGNVLAVGGHAECFIWFVHTRHADALKPSGKRQMLKLLKGHLQQIKQAAALGRPDDFFHFTNIVSMDNRTHVKLLTHLGAVWCDTERTINGHVFKQFYF